MLRLAGYKVVVAARMPGGGDWLRNGDAATGLIGWWMLTVPRQRTGAKQAKHAELPLGGQWTVDGGRWMGRDDGVCLRLFVCLLVWTGGKESSRQIQSTE
jgi:hypothetical protein